MSAYLERKNVDNDVERKPSWVELQKRALKESLMACCGLALILMVFALVMIVTAVVTIIFGLCCIFVFSTFSFAISGGACSVGYSNASTMAVSSVFDWIERYTRALSLSFVCDTMDASICRAYHRVYAIHCLNCMAWDVVTRPVGYASNAIATFFCDLSWFAFQVVVEIIRILLGFFRGSVCFLYGVECDAYKSQREPYVYDVSMCYKLFGVTSNVYYTNDDENEWKNNKDLHFIF